MSALKDRLAHEEAFESRLAELSESERDLIEANLGSPPNVMNVPDAVWRKIEDDRRDALLIILLETGLASARQHGLEGAAAADAAHEWAAERADTLAADYVAHSRELLEREIAEWQASEAESNSVTDTDTFHPATVRGVNEGPDGRELAEAEFDPERLESVFAPARDARMAVTETTRATTVGGELAAEILGTRSGEDYIDGPTDDSCCDVCLDLVGQTRSEIEDDPEYFDGPPFHPNCRHYWTYVTETALAGVA